MARDTVSTSPVNQSRLFLLTRWRLAGLYAGVVGLICTLGGFSLYQIIAHARLTTLDRELESVATTLHDSLEPILTQSGRVNSDIQDILPGICIAGVSCLTQTAVPRPHAVGVIYQGNYYLRLLDNSGGMVALVGFHPKELPISLGQGTWQVLKDGDNNRYRQISLSIHADGKPLWGYIQVGRSVKDLDESLAYLRLILFLGVPVGIVIIGASAWWLSGIMIQPVYRSYHKMQQFTADAAHELRTPIAAIQATVENVRGGISISEHTAEKALAAIERQNHRLAQLVQDLLLLSRLESSGKILHQQQALKKYRSCNLNELVSDLVEGLSVLKIADALTLTTNIRISEPVCVMGDDEQLGRLLSNLVTNAIQYTPAGGNITVILDRDEHDAIIQVKDTGIGIAYEHQVRIFDRFYRVYADRSRKTGGSGLGLAIVQAITQAHHGSIQVQSELDRGSVFTIRLPLE